MATLNSDSISGITTTIFENDDAVTKGYVDTNLPSPPSAVGQDGKILVSTDGTTLVWREISSSFEYTTSGTYTFDVPDISTMFYIEAMSGGDGGSGGIDGTIEPETWNRRTIPYSYYPRGPISYGNGYWSICGESSDAIQFSTDAIVWSIRTVPNANSQPGLAKYQNTFWFGGTYETLSISTDTIHWELRTVNNINAYDGPPTDVLWDGSYYILLGGETSSSNITASTDSIHWEARTGPSLGYLRRIEKEGSLYVLFTGEGFIATSTDAIAWTLRTSIGNALGSNNYNYKSLTYGDGLWLSGHNTSLRVSTDAIHWVFRTTGKTGILYGSAFGGSIWALVGQSGFKATSTDTIHWTQRTSATWWTSQDVFDVGYGKGQFLWTGDQYRAETAEIVQSGQGGNAGNYSSWYIPKSLVTSSTMSINVGSGGTGATINNDSNPGYATTISWTGPVGIMTLTCSSGSDQFTSQNDDSFNFTFGSSAGVNQTEFNQSTGGGNGAFGNNLSGSNSGQINFQGITTFASGGTPSSVNGENAPRYPQFPFGAGGGGGGVNSDGTSVGNGGNGYRGGGGGGSGCNDDGTIFGTSGDGGDGYVKITWY